MSFYSASAPDHALENAPRGAAAVMALVRDDRVLAERIRAGDERVFEAVFRAHVTGLRAFVAGYLRSADGAAEVVQDLFLRLWMEREHWEVRDSVQAYLYRAARNAAFNALRHRRVEADWGAWVATQDDAALARDDWSADASDAVRTRDLAAAARLAMDRLPPRCRQVYMLRRQQGLGYAEIARVMGISTDTVKVQMGNALRLLRERLAPFLAALVLVGHRGGWP